MIDLKTETYKLPTSEVYPINPTQCCIHRKARCMQAVVCLMDCLVSKHNTITAVHLLSLLLSVYNTAKVFPVLHCFFSLLRQLRGNRELGDRVILEGLVLCISFLNNLPLLLLVKVLRRCKCVADKAYTNTYFEPMLGQRRASETGRNIVIARIQIQEM